MPPARILQVIIEEFLQDQPYQASGHVYQKILVKKIRRRIGEDLLNPGRNKEGHMKGELNTDFLKGYGSRVSVEMWDGI